MRIQAQESHVNARIEKTSIKQVPVMTLKPKEPQFDYSCKAKAERSGSYHHCSNRPSDAVQPLC
jgi:hypothetical protein